MELTDLKVFLRIAEEEYHRAAERLGYVQSNVTARVKSLRMNWESPYSTDTPME